VQFVRDLKPWATPLGGRDEVSPDDWRPRRGWGSRLRPSIDPSKSDSPAAAGAAALHRAHQREAAQQVRAKICSGLCLCDLLQENSAPQSFRLLLSILLVNLF